MGFFNKEDPILKEIRTDNKVIDVLQKQYNDLNIQNKESIKKYLDSIASFKENIAGLKNNSEIISTIQKHLKIRYYEKIKKKTLWEKIKGFFSNPNDFLVHMKLRNGDKVHFIADAKQLYIFFESGAYLVDQTCMEWNKTAKMYECFYHQDYSMPIKIDVPVNELVQNMEKTEDEDIVLESNPYVLRKFITGEFVQKAAQGSEILNDIGWIKTMQTIHTIAFLICIVLLIIIMRKP